MNNPSNAVTVPGTALPLPKRLRRYRSLMTGGHPSICDEAADTIEGLYEALAAFLAGADAGHVSVEVDRQARAALSSARGEA